MGDASFSLKGTGQWKLSGPDRGLTLKASADITDFGEYLKKMGLQNLMRGGKGSISGRIKWQKLPWAHRTSDVHGKLEVDLTKERLRLQHPSTQRILNITTMEGRQCAKEVEQ